MSKADKLFVDMCSSILEDGFSSEGQTVRARWEDGTPAHTIKRFGIVNRYDLQEEFPALTLRPTAIKSAVDEMLWIWQKKSNNIRNLNSHIWDEWADENGSIGKAYGYQLGVKYRFSHGEMDQVDNVLWQLKNTPYSRRIMTNIYKFDDLMEMGLEPCAYSMTFNVTGGRPLSGRTNIVMTTDPNFEREGCIICHSKDEVMEKLQAFDTEKVFIAGGANVYDQFMDDCDEFYVTKIDEEYEADRFFPNLDAKGLHVTWESESQQEKAFPTDSRYIPG